MLHAFRIKNGQLWFCNRFTQTTRYLEEKKAGHAIYDRLGELYHFGVLKPPIRMLQGKIGYTKAKIPHKGGTSNTAMIHHAKRTFALVESDLPFHVKVEESEKNFDIKSIGYDDYEGQLIHNVSAHPKVDARTGNLYAFGYNFTEPILHFSVFDKNRFCNLKN